MNGAISNEVIFKAEINKQFKVNYNITHGFYEGFDIEN